MKRILPIILLTYKRTEYALRTIESFKKNYLFNGEIKWIVADDGSPRDHVDKVVAATGDGTRWRTKRVGYGAQSNWAWEKAAAFSPVSFWLEDDWLLTRQFDLDPYYDLLMNDETPGCVRLGHMPIDLALFTVGRFGRMYGRVEKTQNYAFSGNPHMKHERFGQYGRYPEGKNPGDTEIAYDAQIRSSANGPEIWWPLLIGDRPPFGHIGEVQSY